jgi:hypothetical protein
MSIEQLLLVGLLIVLPLVDRLVRVLRARSSQSRTRLASLPVAARPESPSPPPTLERAEAALNASVETEPAPKMRHRPGLTQPPPQRPGPEPLKSGQRPPVRREFARQPLSARVEHRLRSARRARVSQQISTVRDLRGAIVTMVILGPCRAVQRDEPHGTV